MSFLIILFYQEPSALQEVDDHDDLNRSQERTTESDVGWVLVTHLAVVAYGSMIQNPFLRRNAEENRSCRSVVPLTY